MSDSVAEISGRKAPESLDAVGLWLGNVSADLANAYETQTEAMELLHDTMTRNLSKGFATIDGTPLSDPEFAGFSPSFGMGGPDSGAGEGKHVFERFEERSQRLMALSQDLQALHALLSCAPLTSPVDYYNLTSKFGNRKDPFTKRPAWHAGIDLAAWPGTRVRATASGVVTFAGRKGGFGRLVIVNHGCGIETAYGHLRKIYVKKGDSVAHRDSLGEVGSTGRSTGPHVHYEVRIKGKVDLSIYRSRTLCLQRTRTSQSQTRSDNRSQAMKSPNDTFAVLAPNLVVSGNLVSEGNIHVDGTVEGDVQTGHLTIGSSGVVKGRVFGREVKISGRVSGSITACELILEETAIIECDIHYQSLSVARGARINGNCKFSESELDITALSGKKPAAKAESGLAFGDATMEATATQKPSASRAKATSST